MAAIKARGVEFIDIRRETLDDALLEMLLKSLHPEDNSPKSLPTLLLYDEKGLKLFERITYLDEYYLTNNEIEVLQSCADSLAKRLPNGCRLVELGSGNLRKVEILLKALERAKKRTDYYALDLSLPELKRTFAEVATADYKYVKFHALHGSYDDGLAWLMDKQDKPVVIMSLGSSIGNFDRNEAAKFLTTFSTGMTSQDMFIVGLDACQDPEKVFKAYNDSEGVTERFYRNGLDHANSLLGEKAFRQEDWAVEGHYSTEENKHEAFYVAKKDLHIRDAFIRRGEKLKFEESYKYSIEESDMMWRDAELVSVCSYGNRDNTHHIHLLSPGHVEFSKIAKDYARSSYPSIENWEQLWKVWDIATRSMIPKDELLDKPIKLRNNLIFYLGHIPTFADIHMTKATNEKSTDPAYYTSIFERGIDPDVDNPEQCHAHSEIPDTWPPLAEILDYQSRVRDRVISLIESGRASTDQKLARGLWLAYEHEAMHLETFLYMLLQSERVLPPPAVSKPDFKTLAATSKAKRVENKWHTVPKAQITIGLDDAENDLPPERYFGWDNERPSRTADVPLFEAKSRPISNGEYAYYLEQTNTQALPASWTTQSDITNGFDGTTKNGYVNGFSNGNLPAHMDVPSHDFLHGKAVRTVFGPVPLEYVLDWPVMASYDELAAFAEWSEGRIPTFEEVRSIYNYVEKQTSKLANVSSGLISAVNGHLCNEGVEETPPSNPSSRPRPQAGNPNNAAIKSLAIDGPASTLNPEAHFIDLDDPDCNVGFTYWHPTPVTHRSTLSGQGSLGGLWEWTSTNLTPFPGFKAMDLYPGYTEDFFDGKHNICLGGSWATVPRIAGRKSFVNWYQRNYPYVWCTARLVRDIVA